MFKKLSSFFFRERKRDRALALFIVRRLNAIDAHLALLEAHAIEAVKARGGDAAEAKKLGDIHFDLAAIKVGQWSQQKLIDEGIVESPPLKEGKAGQ